MNKKRKLECVLKRNGTPVLWCVVSTGEVALHYDTKPLKHSKFLPRDEWEACFQAMYTLVRQAYDILSINPGDEVIDDTPYFAVEVVDIS